MEFKNANLTNKLEAGRKIADVIAIPLFLLLIFFLINLPNKNCLVKIILILVIIGLVCDTIFTINLIHGINNGKLNLF